MSPARHAALWCKSAFSFLEGASQPEELVESAHALGLAALALTDRDGVYGVVRAHQRARELGLQLLVGSELTLEDGERLVLIAEDRAGYANLCALITAGRLRSAKGSSRVLWSELGARAAGLLALWGGPASALAAAAEPDRRRIELLREAFGARLYALLARHRRDDEPPAEQRLCARARRYGLPLVAAPEVLYHRAERRRLQDVLTCIRAGRRLDEGGRLLKPNAQHALAGPEALEQLYADQPEALARTDELAARARFALGELRYRFPTSEIPGGLESHAWLTQLVEQGARRRCGGAEVPAAMRAQLERELALIAELDYGGYFLAMAEIVDFCRAQDILCQGRGSAASSAVCFCLGITAVDPVRMGLLFERFLSRERAEPPDIDLDIEHERREEVIQHVYRRYGRERAAMVANVVSYRPRSAVREVGRVLGIAEPALVRLAPLLSHCEAPDEHTLELAGIDARAQASRLLLELSAELMGLPRHLSIHPGGFLLGHEPVTSLVPIENASMAERTVIQWDKNDVEALGLFKVDLLGLGALTHLHRCFDALREQRGLELTIASVPPEDPQAYAMIGRADTVGVFQIESRAQMAMLPRLLPRNYYDLVIEISIVRPGPITGGMVHPYLRRRQGLEPVKYPHECLRPVLEKTLGVPLFQEQVMRLAVVAADYSPGEADQLRRDMAAWHKSGRIERHRERLITRMQQKGIAREFGERVYQQIRGFGEYGFPESHAASFALLSYAGAWLKCHYPAEFACGLLNAQPMGFYSVASIVEDARRHGVPLRPIDVLHSRWDCTLESLEPLDASASAQQHAAAPDAAPASAAPGDRALRMGLRYVKGLCREDARRIEAAARGAPCADLEDFCRLARLDSDVLAALAAAGALQGLESARRSALWEARGLAGELESGLCASGETRVEFEGLTQAELIGWDYERSRHSTRGHPLAPLRSLLAANGLPDARTLALGAHGDEVHYAGLVICRQQPATAAGVLFMTLEDETGFVNLVLYQRVFEEFSVLARTQAFLGVSGRLDVGHGTVHVLVAKLWRPALGAAQAAARVPHGGSHDFH